MPNYILLLHDSGTMPPDMSPAEIQAVIQRYVAWREQGPAGGRAIQATSWSTARAASCAGNGRGEGDRRARMPRRARSSAGCSSSKPRTTTKRSRCARTARTWISARSRSAKWSRRPTGASEHTGMMSPASSSSCSAGSRRRWWRRSRVRSARRHLRWPRRRCRTRWSPRCSSGRIAACPTTRRRGCFGSARNRALDRLRHERIVDEKAPRCATRSNRGPASRRRKSSLAGEPPPLDDDELGDDVHDLPSRAAAGSARGADAEDRRRLRRRRDRPRVSRRRKAAIAQRLVRAKRLLRERDVPFGPPARRRRRRAARSVLEAIYLMFNEGYAATAGDVLMPRISLARRCGWPRSSTRHPATAHAAGVGAAGAAAAARRALSGAGQLRGRAVPAARSGSSEWDRALIAEGMRALDRAATGRRASPAITSKRRSPPATPSAPTWERHRLAAHPRAATTRWCELTGRRSWR